MTNTANTITFIAYINQASPNPVYKDVYDPRRFYIDLEIDGYQDQVYYNGNFCAYDNSAYYSIGNEDCNFRLEPNDIENNYFHYTINPVDKNFDKLPLWFQEKMRIKFDELKTKYSEYFELINNN